ncbi:MAG: NTP transferase domain-containing protein, partial [Candidatus Omnitrophica bacterium]|nr:NTP transferase domain-containing protein [Candidatus Omnitrophota bacterium]
MSKVVCMIPARMASTRFPGKPIAKILGVPMIEHVYRRVQLAKTIDEIYIATCDEEIAQVARDFGAPVVMTANTHVRGTDRVAEAASKVEADIVINVQGDEPLVDPASLDGGIQMLKKDPAIYCVNLISVIKDWNVFASPHVVKTVVDQKGK